MKFFVITLIASILLFFSGLLPDLTHGLIGSGYIGFAVVTSIIIFVYSIITIFVIAVKKKDCPNADEVKAFEKKAISIFLIILAYILAYNLVGPFIGRGAILLLILVSLIALPFIIHKRYKSNEKKEANNVLEQLSNSYWEDKK